MADLEAAGSAAFRPLPTVSVVVITYERPDFVERCLDHLAAQTVAPREVLVIDSSLGTATGELVTTRYPSVDYLATAEGRGAMATARNIGYRRSSGEIVSFIDDDAFAEPTWIERLARHFDDPTVGAVGGRQIRDQPGELAEGVDRIGRLNPDGTLDGYFAADPGAVIEVDHLLGANMSYRRTVLDELGGIRDGYHGTCVREETDLCLRVSHAGYRLLFDPDAVVEHVAAPYAKGRRFDLRYQYWAQKNHCIVLIRNFGPTHSLVRRYLLTSVGGALAVIGARARRAVGDARGGDASGAVRTLGGALLRAAVVVGGTVAGVVAGLEYRRTDRRPTPGR
jgi:GT2 family glycosyltransferase